jgi:hypothetical protein
VLSKNGKCEKMFVHTLVYGTFNNEIPEGMQVNHIDENKTNNCLSNLNLMTAKENTNWGTGIERRAKKNEKPVVQYDINNNFIKNWNSARQVKNELGFCDSLITTCCRKRRPTAYGFIWRYKKSED